MSNAVRHLPTRVRFLAVLGMTMCLLACATQKSSPSHYFQKHDLGLPTLAWFPSCRSGGCAAIDGVSLTKKDVAPIKKLFPAKNAEAERRQIAKAVGLWEKIVGVRTGTSADKGDAYSGGMFQEDCVDESTNTTVYLTLMQNMGWLKYHIVLAPQSRAPLFSGHIGGHRTAQIEDNKTHKRYAVDSWFHDNGQSAEIVDIHRWKSGWYPGDAR